MMKEDALAKLIGWNINALLLQTDKTQQELADYLGVAQSSVSMWINGTRMPRMSRVDAMAKFFGVSRADIMEDRNRARSSHSISIPVYARVAAGLPLEAAEDIIDREEIPEALAGLGAYYALRIKGDSMEPRILDGDVVIVRKQEDADDGQIVIALVNGNDAVCKRLRKYKDGIALVSNNPTYDPMYFSFSQTQDIPVRIIGRVVEIRGKL